MDNHGELRKLDFTKLLSSDVSSLQIYDRWVIGYSTKRHSNLYSRQILFNHKLAGDHSLLVTKDFSKIGYYGGRYKLITETARSLQINEAERNILIADIFEAQRFLIENTEGLFSKEDLYDEVPVLFRLRRAETKGSTAGIDYQSMLCLGRFQINLPESVDEHLNALSNQDPWGYFNQVNKKKLVPHFVRTRLGDQTAGGTQTDYLGSPGFIPGSEFILKFIYKKFYPKPRVKYKRVRSKALKIGSDSLHNLEVKSNVLSFNAKTGNMVLSVNDTDWHKTALRKSSNVKLPLDYDPHIMAYLGVIYSVTTDLYSKCEAQLYRLGGKKSCPKTIKSYATQYTYKVLKQKIKYDIKGWESSGVPNHVQQEIMLQCSRVEGREMVKRVLDNFV